MRDEANMRFSVMRYMPEKDEKPHYEDYEVSWFHEMSVLDGLNYIRDHYAPDLGYRASCRMAVCGSCAMMINGAPRLACKTFIRDYVKTGRIQIEPLENFPIERDLVVDISDMIEKVERVIPYTASPETDKRDNNDNNKDNVKTPGLQTPQQLEKYRQFAQCIECGCCYAACPQYKLHRDFMGPAAMTLAYRYNHDNRDHNRTERMAILSRECGVWRCTSVGYCSDVCPKAADPAAAIQMDKEESAFDYVRYFVKKMKSR